MVYLRSRENFNVKVIQTDPDRETTCMRHNAFAYAWDKISRAAATLTNKNCESCKGSSGAPRWCP